MNTISKSYGFIQVSGPDAATFLQGQCTGDITVIHDTPLLTACCNRQGRMIANFWVWREGDNFYLELPNSMVDKLIEHLQKYVVFSKVSLETVSDYNTPIKKQNITPIWILPETSEQFTPQMIDLQKHGGVSFTKGCYVGQEIIARTEHRGTLKRHLYQITFDTNVTTMVGDTIKNADGQKMGTAVAVTDAGIFAVIEDRAIKENLMINGHKINLLARKSPLPPGEG